MHESRGIAPAGPPAGEATCRGPRGAAAAMGAQPGRVRAAALWAVAIVLVAAGLRFATLGTWSVWIDEAFTLHDARHVPPPYFVHYLLTRGVVGVLGDGEWALRLLPCLAGLGTIALLLAARPAAEDPPGTGLAAAAILALAPWHLFMSQNARGYALQAGLVLLAFLCADGRLSRAGRPRPFAAGAALLAALGCHPTTMFFAPGIALVWLRHTAGRRRAWAVLASAAVLAVAVAAYLPLAEGYRAAKGTGALRSLAQFAASYGFLCGPPLLLCALLGCRPTPRWPAELLVLAPAALGLLLAALHLFVTGYHAFASLPLAALLAARGVLAAGRARALLAVLLAVLLAGGQGLGLWAYHASSGLRPRYREAAAWLAEARAQGSALFATQAPPVAYHLGERHDLRWPASVSWLLPWNLARLEEAAAAGPVALVVHPDELQALAPAARARLEAVLAEAFRPAVLLPSSYGPKDMTLRLHRTR